MGDEKTTRLAEGRKLQRQWGVSESMMLRFLMGLVLVATVGCGDRRRSVTIDGGTGTDAVARDVDFSDAVNSDTVGLDAVSGDTTFRDSGLEDVAAADGDAGSDAVSTDTGSMDAGRDSSPTDTGTDSGATDVPADSGPPGGCISGATGTHALRFRWEGSGSTAYVRYETNTLPDTSRWRVTANSRSIGYRPVFSDPFLGDGGLELSGTVFIDIELSTVGLARVDQATISILGRSFNTTASGSFSWRTFSGMGASPHGGVANSAPYEWYSADATSSLPGGDDSILLRIEAGPPSNALIVNQVEVCFTAR